MINPIERQTQNRIIKLFTQQLGYLYYGNWEKREHNSNVEETYLKKFLTKQGFTESLVKKAVKEVYD
jgi:type I restriction enzyme R subunit